MTAPFITSRDARASGACPVCRKPAVPEQTPFCSRGCKDRDLLQWLDEGYRLPGPPTDTEGLDSPPDRG